MMATESIHFGRLDMAAGPLPEEPEASIATFADSLTGRGGLTHPIYLHFNKRTSSLVASPIGNLQVPPYIAMRVEGNNCAAARALSTRNSVVVMRGAPDACPQDLELIQQAHADGLAAIPVGRGEYRGILLLCGTASALKEIAADPRHYARLGKLVGRAPAEPAPGQAGTGQEGGEARAERLRQAALKLNTPLGIIMNHMAILKVLAAEHGEIDRELRVIDEELDHLVHLAHCMAVEEAGDGEPGGRPDVNTLVQDLVKVTAPTWHSKGLQVITHLSPGMRPLCCDRLKLEQILRNLLMHAMDASPQGSTVMVETRPLTNHRQEQFIELRVTDSGPGILPGQAGHLFDPVEAAPGSGQAGRGLAIVKVLTESLAGTLSFESQPTGTTFHITFPQGRCRAQACA